jgi:hypothetical protein
MVGKYRAEIFDVNGLTLRTVKRTEHLLAIDKKAKAKLEKENIARRIKGSLFKTLLG